MIDSVIDEVFVRVSQDGVLFGREVRINEIAFGVIE